MGSWAPNFNSLVPLLVSVLVLPNEVFLAHLTSNCPCNVLLLDESQDELIQFNFQSFILRIHS